MGQPWGAVPSADPAPLMQPQALGAALGRWSSPASRWDAAGPRAQSFAGLRGACSLPGVSLFSTCFSCFKEKKKKGNRIFHRLFGRMGGAKRLELWVQKHGSLCPEQPILGQGLIISAPTITGDTDTQECFWLALSLMLFIYLFI